MSTSHLFSPGQVNATCYSAGLKTQDLNIRFWSLPIEIRIVGVGARLEEDARQVEVAVLRGQVERREFVGVVLVQLGASVDQVLRHLETEF